MRKFIITSPAYTGEAEAAYDETGRLILINLQHTNMDAQLIVRFKAKVPALVDELEPAFAESKCTIIESEYVITFEMFYKDYPLKRNRYKVQKQWDKMNKTEQVKAFVSLAKYKKYLQRLEWQTPMIADRYLRDREYETEWNKL